jgi:hypothetical protein
MTSIPPFGSYEYFTAFRPSEKVSIRVGGVVDQLATKNRDGLDSDWLWPRRGTVAPAMRPEPARTPWQCRHPYPREALSSIVLAGAPADSTGTATTGRGRPPGALDAELAGRVPKSSVHSSRWLGDHLASPRKRTSSVKQFGALPPPGPPRPRIVSTITTGGSPKSPAQNRCGGRG